MVLLPMHGRRRRSRKTVSSERKRSEEDPTRGPHTCQLCPQAKDARVRLRLLIPSPNRHPSFLERMAEFPFPMRWWLCLTIWWGENYRALVSSSLPISHVALLLRKQTLRVRECKTQSHVKNSWTILTRCYQIVLLAVGDGKTDGRTHRHWDPDSDPDIHRLDS